MKLNNPSKKHHNVWIFLRLHVISESTWAFVQWYLYAYSYLSVYTTVSKPVVFNVLSMFHLNLYKITSPTLSYSLLLSQDSWLFKIYYFKNQLEFSISTKFSTIYLLHYFISWQDSLVFKIYYFMSRQNFLISTKCSTSYLLHYFVSFQD